MQGRPEPITYYHRDGGIGRAITAIRERKGAPLRVAVIGLGSGTLTCASTTGETWKFFEIDQSMVDTARDPKYFSYVQKCEPELRPTIGDARLTFAREPNGVYDVIIVDAYSSDAIPIHLATKEAMAIYKDKLSPQGAVVMHVSNRHLELASVVVGIADANGLKSWVYDEDSGRDSEYIFATNVVVSARARKPMSASSLPRSNGRKPTPTRTSGSGPTITATCSARSIGGFATANSGLNSFLSSHEREPAGTRKIAPALMT